MDLSTPPGDNADSEASLRSRTNELGTEHAAATGDILLVDDTLDNLRVLTVLLAQRGYEVRAVTTGSAGRASEESGIAKIALSNSRVLRWSFRLT